MTEEIAATPGWVTPKLDAAFASIPDAPGVDAARAAYARCLADRKAPGAPSDMLGAEFNACRPALRRALLAAGVDAPVLEPLDQALEALEAEIAGAS